MELFLVIAILVLAVALVWQVCLASYCVRSKRRAVEKVSILERKVEALTERAERLEGGREDVIEAYDLNFLKIVSLLEEGLKKEIAKAKKSKDSPAKKGGCAELTTALRNLFPSWYLNPKTEKLKELMKTYESFCGIDGEEY